MAPHNDGGRSFERALVILNPAAGQNDADRVATDLEQSLQDAGIDPEVRRTEGEGDAEKWARAAADEGFDLVVAVGGDGTVAECAGGLARANKAVPLQIIPQGTANVVAGVLGISTDVKEAAALAGEARVRRFDVLRFPELDRHFLLTVAIGFPAEVVEQAPREMKDRLGFGAYLWAGIREAWNTRASRFTFEMEGRKEEADAHTVLVGNMGGLKAMGLEMAAEVTPHDGALDLYVGVGETPLDFFHSVVAFFSGNHEEKHMAHYRARRVRITANPPLRVQADGEVIGKTPVEVEVLESALALVVPPEYGED